jgi:4'-phosphopantetheinyl transferase
MPLVEQECSPDRAWGLWKIEESEDLFSEGVKLNESVPVNITHPNKRLEFLAGRVLVKNLLQIMQMEFHGITKDFNGKPFLNQHAHQLSISHSYPYVTALIDKHKSVGIDLEQIKLKLLRIAPRILRVKEQRDAGDNLAKHCIYWCAKEAMLKVHGEKNLTFAQNLLVEPFSIQNEGDLIGRIIVDGSETTLSLHYRLMKDFALVYNL